MAKIDLKKSLGFSVVIEDGAIVSSELPYKESKTYTISDLREQLLNRDITSQETFYTIYSGFDEDGVYAEKNLSLKLYLIQPSLAGIEYVKTKGIRVSKYPRLLEIVNGAGIILMQNFEKDFNGDLITASVKKDMKIIVPPDYAVSIVNTRSTLLAVSEVVCSDAHEIDELDDMNGMAYYVIRKNAKQEIVRNPVYKMVNNARKVQWDKIATKLGITLKTPIIKQILRKYDKFNWLFTEIPVSI